MEISTATTCDLDRVRSFYKETGYTPEISENDVIILTQEGKKIFGAARLCLENGVMVLRGMRVVEQHQRTGIGTQLLKKIDRMIVNNECFCLPFNYLENFYGSIGFHRIGVNKVPPHLGERFSQYIKIYPNIILMKRDYDFRKKAAN